MRSLARALQRAVLGRIERKDNYVAQSVPCIVHHPLDPADAGIRGLVVEALHLDGEASVWIIERAEPSRGSCPVWVSGVVRCQGAEHA